MGNDDLRHHFIIIFFGLILTIIGAIISRDYFIFKLVDNISVSQEQKIADKVISSNSLNLKIIKDEKINQYFQKLLTNLLPYIENNHNYRYQISIVDSDEANAFAFMGGYVFVNKGLIKKIDFAEELLAVISHEIAHINQRHYIKSIIEKFGSSIIFNFLFTGIPVNEISEYLVNQKFSREIEKEADLLALNYLAKANINPKYLADFIEKIDDKSRKDTEFLVSHPSSVSRINYINQYISNNFYNKKFRKIYFDYQFFKIMVIFMF